MARIRSAVVLAAVTGALTGFLVGLFDTIVVEWLGEGVAETTGRAGFIVPGLLAAIAAELVMGRASVTAYQRRLTSDN